ncbi:hypothetical protein BH23VER1_BH23VER1_25090 [soil metagenome]
MSAQIHRVHSLRPTSILEVGKGNGFVSDYLRKAGHDIVTVDINPALEPDHVGDILKLDELFGAAQFDLVFCAEVLEHIPFECFERAIGQLARVARRHGLITLPRAQRILLDFQFSLKLPFLGRRESGMFAAVRHSGVTFRGHHWELGSGPEQSLDRIEAIIGRYFEIVSSTRERLQPYHQEIVMRKRECEDEPNSGDGPEHR